eukprot:gene22916-biopygen16303
MVGPAPDAHPVWFGRFRTLIRYDLTGPGRSSGMVRPAPDAHPVWFDPGRSSGMVRPAPDAHPDWLDRFCSTTLTLELGLCNDSLGSALHSDSGPGRSSTRSSAPELLHLGYHQNT